MDSQKLIRLQILKFLSDVKNGKETVNDTHDLGANGWNIFKRIGANLTTNEFKAQLDYLEERLLIRRKPERIPATENKVDQLKLAFYKITDDGTDMLELESNTPAQEKKEIQKEFKNFEELEELDIFISHSSFDIKFIEKLVVLLRSSLNIPAKKIRCSSVDGYRLSVGVNTDEQLRKEVHDAKILIGVITPNSIKSAYVLFELGARWGTKKKMFPILACGADPNILGGPLKTINSLDCDNASQVHQLIDEISVELHISKESPALYQNNVDQLMNTSKELILDSALAKNENGLIYKDNTYWKENGKNLDGPFCQLCWDKDQKLLRLSIEKVDDGEKVIDHRFCRACKSIY
jgi:hypothetical protein